MRLKFNTLLLRISTEKGDFGVKIGFTDGLNILRADNSSGKSTCLQSMIYALGLEGMWSARHDVPMPHVVTDFIEYKGKELPVLESEVFVEIENSAGEVLTVARLIQGLGNRHLIRTWDGSAVSSPSEAYIQQDYYVREPGAASSNLGFHTRLAEFIGWELPMVPKYGGSESPLYMECIFPLLVVEQKSGWSGLLSNFPSQFKIQEPAKKAIEFIISLDVFQNSTRRQKIRNELNELILSWKEIHSHCVALADSVSGIYQGLPPEPTTLWPPLVRPSIGIPVGNDWLPLKDEITQAIKRLHVLEEQEIPKVQKEIKNMEIELNQVQNKLIEKQIVAKGLLEDIVLEEANVNNLRIRLDALSDDLVKYQDTRKLRRLGSIQKLQYVSGHCPTCGNEVKNTLLPEGSISNPMSIEENIEYIQEQKNIFELAIKNSRNVIKAKRKQLEIMQRDAHNIQRRIRTLKRTLTSEGKTPSLAAIQEKIRLEEFASSRQALINKEEDYFEHFNAISERWNELQTELTKIPKDDLSSEDETKIDRFKRIFVEQLKAYKMTSVNPNKVSISKDNYRPIYEGMPLNLQFDLSASDFIRTIWSYLMALLEMSRFKEWEINHPGILIVDEPRQQGAAEASFDIFLKRASLASKYGQQVLVATSEEPRTLNKLVKSLSNVNIIRFEGKILSMLQKDNEDINKE